MTSEYSAAVKELLKYHGEDVTYTHTLSATRTSSGLSRANTTSAYSVRGVFRFYNSKEVSSLVQEGDRRLIIAGDDLTNTPKPNDKVTDSDGVTYRVISVDKRKHRNGVVAWLLQVRGGSDV